MLLLLMFNASDFCKDMYVIIFIPLEILYV